MIKKKKNIKNFPHNLSKQFTFLFIRTMLQHENDYGKSSTVIFNIFPPSPPQKKKRVFTEVKKKLFNKFFFTVNPIHYIK